MFLKEENPKNSTQEHSQRAAGSIPPYLDLPRDDPVEVDGRRGRRPALTLGQPLLLGLPLLDAAGDVDGDATAPKVAPADVAGDGHADR
jgi:hypothetical protein